MLPQKEGKPVHLVIPALLQMGWIESPGYFCAASETGRDVTESYAQSAIGSLPAHKFLMYTKGSPEYEALPDVSPDGRPLRFMIEVYVDDYMHLAIARSKRDLDHMMHGMHSFFPTTMTTERIQSQRRR